MVSMVAGDIFMVAALVFFVMPWVTDVDPFQIHGIDSLDVVSLFIHWVVVCVIAIPGLILFSWGLFKYKATFDDPPNLPDP